MCIRDSNGAVNATQGAFRILCSVSHFAYEDPIIRPDQPGGSHLHMFWGNTNASAFTNTTVPGNPSDPNDLLNHGGSTCQGGALNRSAYWMPALVSGPADANRQIALPKVVLLYYKSHRATEVNPLPAGIQLLVGNVNAGGSVNDSFAGEHALHWGCYDPSRGQTVAPLLGVIPGTNGTAPCAAGRDIQATIQFPQCLAVDGGGRPVLTSPDFVSHTLQIPNNDPCPSSHPYRVPQISYLVRWENPGAAEVANWRLSSDRNADAPTGQVPFPGGSLHGDWLGGWNDDAIQLWTDGCFDPGGNNPRNCSLGQTGQNGTGLQFDRIEGSLLTNMVYDGPMLVDDPSN